MKRIDINKILVTVIVPVYNVEKYLPKCLDSILTQNHRKLQVLIVNDGSTDGCPKICDQYAQRDSRVQVIHQENGGLSHARNVALDRARGEYILFVDSDDWITRGSIQRELRVIVNEEVPILLFKYGYSYDGEKYAWYKSTLRRKTKLTRNELISNYLLPGKITVSATACSKLYHASIWENRRFKEGILFEDDNIMLDVLLGVDKAVYLDEFGYVQYKRPGSITQCEYSHNHMVKLDNVNADINRIVKAYGTDSDYYVYIMLKKWQRAIVLLDEIKEYLEHHGLHNLNEQLTTDIKYCIHTGEEAQEFLRKKNLSENCKETVERYKMQWEVYENFYGDII